MEVLICSYLSWALIFRSTGFDTIHPIALIWVPVYYGKGWFPSLPTFGYGLVWLWSIHIPSFFPWNVLSLRCFSLLLSHFVELEWSWWEWDIRHVCYLKSWIVLLMHRYRYVFMRKHFGHVNVGSWSCHICNMVLLYILTFYLGQLMQLCHTLFPFLNCFFHKSRFLLVPAKER